MTTIAAKIYDDRIEVGSDSQITNGWTSVNSELGYSKVFKGIDFVLGGAGT